MWNEGDAVMAEAATDPVAVVSDGVKAVGAALGHRVELQLACIYSCMYTRDMSNELKMTWTAYTDKGFDKIYEAAAAALGHRPQFRVTHGGDHARVITTDADYATALAIVAAAEAAVSA